MYLSRSSNRQLGSKDGWPQTSHQQSTKRKAECSQCAHSWWPRLPRPYDNMVCGRHKPIKQIEIYVFSTKKHVLMTYFCVFCDFDQKINKKILEPRGGLIAHLDCSTDHIYTRQSGNHLKIKKKWLGFVVGKTIFGRFFYVFGPNFAKNDQKSTFEHQNRCLKIVC